MQGFESGFRTDGIMAVMAFVGKCALSLSLILALAATCTTIIDSGRRNRSVAF